MSELPQILLLIAELYVEYGIQLQQKYLVISPPNRKQDPTTAWTPQGLGSLFGSPGSPTLFLLQLPLLSKKHLYLLTAHAGDLVILPDTVLILPAIPRPHLLPLCLSPCWATLFSQPQDIWGWSLCPDALLLSFPLLALEVPVRVTCPQRAFFFPSVPSPKISSSVLL